MCDREENSAVVVPNETKRPRVWEVFQPGWSEAKSPAPADIH